MVCKATGYRCLKVILALITMSFSHLMRESFIKDFRVKLENDKINQTEIDKMNQTEIDKTNQTKIIFEKK